MADPTSSRHTPASGPKILEDLIHAHKYAILEKSTITRDPHLTFNSMKGRRQGAYQVLFSPDGIIYEFRGDYKRNIYTKSARRWVRDGGLSPSIRADAVARCAQYLQAAGVWDVEKDDITQIKWRTAIESGEPRFKLKDGIHPEVSRKAGEEVDGRKKENNAASLVAALSAGMACDGGGEAFGRGETMTSVPIAAIIDVGSAAQPTTLAAASNGVGETAHKETEIPGTTIRDAKTERESSTKGVTSHDTMPDLPTTARMDVPRQTVGRVTRSSVKRYREDEVRARNALPKDERPSQRRRRLFRNDIADLLNAEQAPFCPRIPSDQIPALRIDH
ncbi:hypothetical protein OQA88_9158 [Cercophora sp. LCS_1]